MLEAILSLQHSNRSVPKQHKAEPAGYVDFVRLWAWARSEEDGTAYASCMGIQRNDRCLRRRANGQA
jgi:hypothetical protein